MYAEILTIGTEITTGSILNTNNQFLSKRLLDLGIDVHYHSTVDDNVDRIHDAITLALKRSDLIITTGGLGPTSDDMTKEIISKSLGLDLILDDEMVKTIRDKFLRMNSVMTDNNLKQATKLQGSIFLKNSIGTAPGIFLKQDEKIVIMLPGVPSEMKIMFDREVIPLIKQDYNIIKRSVNTVGIGEAELEMKIKDLLDLFPNISIATFPSDGQVEIKIIGRGLDKSNIERNMNTIIKTMENRFKEYIFGYDNIPMEMAVFNLLKDRNLQIGFCESCTGGLISARFSRIPGVSEVFNRSIISYSNDSKIEELGVNPTTIDKYGAVSEKTALEMVNGMLNRTDLDIALSVTGLAGPDGDTKDSPIGLVYICISDRLNTEIIKSNFVGNREIIQDKATMKAFSELRKFLLSK
ncbi:MAG: competence/damage-inducible protein A [Tissierellaceae bacterium]|nr:competence/damage-inducible protein A [Tissierellaceae bacterium]